MYKISQIKKKYKKKEILQEVSLSFEEGECIGLLGPNGCGKTTLMAILAGVLKADYGEFWLDDQNLLQNQKLRQEILGYVPQGIPLIEELSAWDNLRLWYEKEDLLKELESGVCSMLGIQEFLKTPVNKMSGGMKKRVSIACAMANHPKLLLLDEPSTALDLICKEQIYDYLSQFKSQGGTILLITHDTEELKLCDKCFLMKNGGLIPYEHHGDIHELVQSLEKNQVVE